MKVIVTAMLLFAVCEAATVPELSPLSYLLRSAESQTQRIVFRPEDGLKNRERFEKKYGRRGEKLIALLGTGIFTDNEDQQLSQKHSNNEQANTSIDDVSTTAYDVNVTTESSVKILLGTS